MEPVVGRVKWFDATRGFGFVVSDEIDGDILVHFSVLREHGRRSLPEGALIECIPVRLDRGLQAKKILSIDCRGLAAAAQPSMPPLDEQDVDRKALAEAAGEFEPVEVKWFNRVKGYGFVKRIEDRRAGRLRAHGNGAEARTRRSAAGAAARGADRARARRA